jgi:hypothetical protein
MRTQRFLTAFIITLLLSCGSSFEEAQNSESETRDLEMLDFEVNEHRNKHKKYPELEAHYTFNDSLNLGFNATGKNNLKNNGVSFIQNGTNNGIAQFNGQSYFRAARSGKKKGFFHHSFKYRTYMFWIQPSNTNDEQIILDEGGGVNSVAVRIVDNKIEAAIMTCGVKRRVIISTDFQEITNWSHLAVVFEKGYFRFYLNATLISEVCTSFRKVRKHPNGGGIGSQYGRNAFTGRTEIQAIKNFFSGYMEDFKIYNISLSSEQILAEYDNNKPQVIDGTGGGGPR